MLRQLAWIVGLVALAGRAAAADLPGLPAPGELPQLAGSAAPGELTQAAACIERGDLAAAIAIISRHVEAHPGQFTVRAYLAELHWRHGHWAQARTEFARFIADAQAAHADPARMVHGHTRLMALAEKSGERGAEHLHRGIGLYWLARREVDRATAESLYCKAAGELAVAERERPDDARPKWYLHRVWSALDQPLRARVSLDAAGRLAAFSDLTPAELADLSLAGSSESGTSSQFP